MSYEFILNNQHDIYFFPDIIYIFFLHPTNFKIITRVNNNVTAVL